MQWHCSREFILFGTEVNEHDVCACVNYNV